MAIEMTTDSFPQCFATGACEVLDQLDAVNQKLGTDLDRDGVTRMCNAVFEPFALNNGDVEYADAQRMIENGEGCTLRALGLLAGMTILQEDAQHA